MDSFDSVFDICVGQEGAELDLTSSDRGNWTGGEVGSGELRGSRYGISAAAYPHLDIASLTEADARSIYRRDYWAPMHCDVMPAPLALLVFDPSLNNGPGAATMFLQAAVETGIDGNFGPGTLRALQAALATKPALDVALAVHAERIAYMSQLGKWQTFGLRPGYRLGNTLWLRAGGWSTRLAVLPARAAQLA